MAIERRLEQLETELQQMRFQVRLLFEGTRLDRYLYEYDVTEQQYADIVMKLPILRNLKEKRSHQRRPHQKRTTISLQPI